MPLLQTHASSETIPFVKHKTHQNKQSLKLSDKTKKKNNETVRSMLSLKPRSYEIRRRL